MKRIDARATYSHISENKGIYKITLNYLVHDFVG